MNGGPIPKRDAERRRRNKDVIETMVVDLDEASAGEVQIPVPEEDWHPIVRRWYDSLKESGQSRFYEPSDWSTAFFVAEVMDRELKPQPVVTADADGGQKITMMTQPVKGASLNAIYRVMTSLMTTEGERRRLKIEIERKGARDLLDGELPQGVSSITTKREQVFR